MLSLLHKLEPAKLLTYQKSLMLKTKNIILASHSRFLAQRIKNITKKKIWDKTSKRVITSFCRRHLK